MAEQGAAAEALVLEVLAPAQREVGRRWEDGRWSVAQEHAATAVTDTALGLLALEAEPSPDGGHAVVACVEGEWHAMPARMAAEVLRLRGWHVTFLGGSVPADDLARYVGSQRPDVVGLSCSMPVSLKGAARSIESCRQAGVPVLAGGSGFGPEGRYAARLGASAWAADPLSATALVESGLGNGSGASSPAIGTGDDEHRTLEREKDDIVSAALAGVEGGDARLREALAFLLSTLESGLFVDDPQAVGAGRPAIERLLADGDPSSESTSLALDALFGILQGFPRTWALAEASRLLEIQPGTRPHLKRT